MTQPGIQKALVAIGTAVVASAAALGVVIDSDTVAAVVTAIGAVLVYLVPNRPA